MDLIEVMRTTFAARELTEEPVDDATLYRLLDHARFAPSGGNRQGWRVIVVRDPQVRAELARLAAPTMQRYVAQMIAGETPWNAVRPSAVSAETIAATPAPAAVLQPIVTAPVLLLVCQDLETVAAMDQNLERVGVVAGASVYPFVWNILLAARNEGLGGTLTTFLAPAEAAVQKLLDLPAHFAVAALLPLGRPRKQLSKLSRRPVEEFAAHERWGGRPLTAG